jgi:CHAD domain-containing protein
MMFEADQRRRLALSSDEPMSAAGRKVLRHHFERMVIHEPGVRLGEDIEALHDMRVATRRMRAAFRIFDDFYQAKAIAPHLKGLKRTGRALGPVRDLDVLGEKVHHDLETVPALQGVDLDAFLTDIEARRWAARQVMLRYLEGAKYARFKARFRQFLDTPGEGSRPVVLEGDSEPRPYRVRHVVPPAIYGRLAAVRAYDEWVIVPSPPLERLHALRIACKRLRYTLEFFRSILGPEAKGAIKAVVAVQDHLGALQDAVVAGGILRQFLTQAAPPQPGIETYLAVKEKELQDLVVTFPRVWQQLTGTQFSRMVAQAVAVL